MLIHRKSPGKHWISNFLFALFLSTVAILHKHLPMLCAESGHRFSSKFRNGYKMQIFMGLLSVQITSKFAASMRINLLGIIHTANALVSILASMRGVEDDVEWGAPNEIDLRLNWIVPMLLMGCWIYTRIKMFLVCKLSAVKSSSYWYLKNIHLLYYRECFKYIRLASFEFQTEANDFIKANESQ